MARSEDTSQSSRSLVCPRCNKQFITYQTGRTPHCPRCGRPVREIKVWRLLVLLMLMVLVALGVAAGYYYLAQR